MRELKIKNHNDSNSKKRKTQEMLENLNREQLEEVTDCFGHFLGRLLEAGAFACQELDQLDRALDSQCPAYAAFKEELEAAEIWLDLGEESDG